jgi:uncharacterized phage protein (TIGR01671 family)
MKELLFRVWNGQEMVYDITVGRFGVFYVNPGSKSDGLDENDTASLTPYNTKYPDNIPVMQFTGLSDKNKVYIFEGDIISGSYLKNYGNYGQYKSISFKGVVKYFFGQFYIKIGETKEGVDRRVYFSQLWPLSPNSVEVEIIGNIHENPELLSK